MAKAIREEDYAGFHRDAYDGRWYIWCPGCYEWFKQQYPDDERFWMNGAVHCFSEKVHTFDGNTERPTLSPSLLVSGGEGDRRCHSFVKDGKIQFLGDCTHPLAGQTVDLLDCPVREAA
jgi:hypothetical protein